jgi:FkbM family methyltransferase
VKRYSQNDEQDVVLEFFKGNCGRVLEVGAFDGVTFSNSRALIELGWHGVLVEPDPFNVTQLLDNIQQGSSVQVIAAAVKNGAGLTALSIETTAGRGWASTICPRLMTPDRILRPHVVRTLTPTITMWELEYFGPFDFISIDAEGMDLEILRSTPKTMLDRCRLLCIEPTDLAERDVMKRVLGNIGYAIHHETPENIIARNERQEDRGQ